MAVEGGIRIPGEIATGGGDGGGETKSGPLSTLGDDARARGKSNMGEHGEAHENGSGKAVNKDSNPGENTRDTETSGDAVADLLGLAIESIPSYVEQSAMMLVLVPVCEHADRDGEACGYQSWRRRGWCRMEYMSAVLARTNVLIMVVKGAEAQPEFVKSADALLLAPGQGDFTCCWNGHKMGGLPVPCDKDKIRLVLEAMLAAKIDDLYDQGQWFHARFMACMQHWFLRGLVPVLLPPPSTGGDAEHTGEGKSGSAEIAGGGAVSLTATTPTASTTTADATPILPLPVTAGSGVSVPTMGEMASSISTPRSPLGALERALRWRGNKKEGQFVRDTGASLLFWAAMSNDLPAARKLLQTGDSFAARDARAATLETGIRKDWPELTVFAGWTPVHAAMAYASWDVVTVLLDARAPCFAEDAKGFDPLMWASASGQADNVREWLRRYPFWEMERRERVTGNTAAGLSVLFGAGNGAETSEWLLASGADAAAVNDAGHSLLSMAVFNADGDEQLVQSLLTHHHAQKTLDLPQKPRTLKWAATYTAARLAVNVCGSSNQLHHAISTWEGSRPLHTAAAEGNLVALRVLLDVGADATARDKRGLTPMEAASRQFGGEVPHAVQVVLEADINSGQ